MALGKVPGDQFIRREQWFQNTRVGLTTSPQTEGFWANSIITAVTATPQREGCSRAPDDASSLRSKDTDASLENLMYVDGMNNVKYRLESSRTKAFGKHKKARPPTLCMQEELAGDNAHSIRDVATSIASSRRSSAYRAVEEAAGPKTAMLEAKTEAQRALACLVDTRADCIEQHKVITAKLEAMQSSVKASLRANSQQQTVQSAKLVAMGNRSEEMKDLLLQRELCCRREHGSADG